MFSAFLLTLGSTQHLYSKRNYTLDFVTKIKLYNLLINEIKGRTSKKWMTRNKGKMCPSSADTKENKDLDEYI